MKKITRPLLLILLVFFSASNLITYQVKAEIIKAEKAIVVEDYTWASSSMGNQAILQEITLKNKSLQTFENIEIEIELYSINSIPLGSLRGTVKDVLPPGETKTYENVKFGLIHTDMQRSIARVVGADFVETGTPVLPSSLILVKNWEWTGGQFGTEGILKEITLENRSNNNYKDIKVRINQLDVKGSAKVSSEGYTANVTIHGILPAQSTSTYNDVNVGFRHPDSTRTNIYVLDAKEISNKELRYIIKKEEKEGKYDTAKKVKVSIEEDPDENLSLAERYRKKLEESDVAYDQDYAEGEISDDSGFSTETTTADTVASLQTMPKEERITKVREFDKDIILRNPTSEKIMPKEIDLGYEEEDEVALPEADIVIKDFKWGGGVPGSQGFISELTLKNNSGITYSKIDFEVEFRSRQGIPLATNDFTIIDVLPPRSTKTFENIKLGVIVVLPNERDINIRVTDAKSSL